MCVYCLAVFWGALFCGLACFGSVSGMSSACLRHVRLGVLFKVVGFGPKDALLVCVVWSVCACFHHVSERVGSYFGVARRLRRYLRNALKHGFCFVCCFCCCLRCWWLVCIVVGV